MTFAYALLRYDIFHFFCDRGLLPSARRIGIRPREMELLRRAGKRLYTYTYGADVRTRQLTLALGRFNFCMDCPEPGKYCQCDDATGAANVASIARYATRMLAMGDMKAYVPGAMDLHFWPLEVGSIPFAGTSWRPGERLRIAHAPNHPFFKGTRHLLEAVTRLRGEGHDIELVQIQGVPNAEVLRRFAEVHLVAEQFIGGFHGYTALEAMAVGKPVIAYLRGPDMVLEASQCPIISADPDTLFDVLRDCLRGKYDLAELGRRGRAYVSRFYSSEAVAARLGNLYLESAALPPRLDAALRAAVARETESCLALAAHPA